MTPRSFLQALLLSLALVGCEAGPEAAAPPGGPAAAPQAQAPQAQAAPAPAGDPSFAPLTSRDSHAAAPAPAVPTPVEAPPLPVDAGTSGNKILAPGASFDLPAGWSSEPPSSSMRLAQAVAPGSQGPASLAVFYFGAGGGGGVEANLERWIGQMDLEPGKAPERDTFAAGNFRVTWVLALGTLKGGTMGGPAEATPNAALLGAVVEGDQGPWFFKMTGPSKTIAEQRQAFLGMLRSASPKF
jgi:hypothetical protein